MTSEQGPVTDDYRPLSCAPLRKAPLLSQRSNATPLCERQPPRFARGRLRSRQGASHAETEEDYVAVLHDVLLAFEADLAVGLGVLHGLSSVPGAPVRHDHVNVFAVAKKAMATTKHAMAKGTSEKRHALVREILNLDLME